MAGKKRDILTVFFEQEDDFLGHAGQQCVNFVGKRQNGEKVKVSGQGAIVEQVMAG